MFEIDEKSEISLKEKKNFYNLYDLPLTRAFFRETDDLSQTLSFETIKNGSYLIEIFIYNISYKKREIKKCAFCFE